MSKIYTADSFVGGAFTGSFSGTATSASYALTASNIQGGTANYIPIWNTNTSLSSSVLYQSSGNVGIGTTSPSYKLDVNGDGRFNGGLTLPAISTITLGTTWNTGRLGIYNGATEFFVLDVPNNRVVNSLNKYLGDGPTSFGTLNADEIKFVTSNTTERMRITSAGNVGIGTTTPAGKLHVYNTAIRNFYEASNGNVEQHFLYSGNQDWVLGLDKADSNKFKLANADDAFASAKLTVTTGGFVGIGTASPVTKFHIKGNNNEDSLFILQNNAYSTGGGGGIVFQPTSTGGLSIGRYAEAYLLDILANGNVGIGTTAPSKKLEVAGGYSRFEHIEVKPGYAQYFEQPGSVQKTTLGFSGPHEFTYSNEGSNVIMNTGWNGTLTLDTGYAGFENGKVLIPHGNVGIGTTNPYAKLDVYGNLYLGDGTNNFNANIRGVVGTSYAWNIDSLASGLQVKSTSGAEGVTFQPFGNVGIGITAPNTRLTVSTVWTNSTDTPIISSQIDTETLNKIGTFVESTATAATSMTFHTHPANSASSEKMRITSNGNIGIGTTSPSAKLEVAGDALINSLTVGRGSGNVSGNVALGYKALEGNGTGDTNTAIGSYSLRSNTSGYNNIAIGYNSNTDNNIVGATVIGPFLNTNPSGNPLGDNCIAISQHHPDFTNQTPHIYVPDQILVPHSTSVDVLVFNTSLYAGAFVEYLIRTTDGGEFAAGTVTVGWKTSGSGTLNDTRDISWSSFMDDFTFSYNGVDALTLTNSTNSDAWIRITSRLVMNGY